MGPVTYVTASLPWPVTSGGHLRTLANLAALSAIAPTHLIAFPFGPGGSPSLPLASTLIHPVRSARAGEKLRNRVTSGLSGTNPYLERFRRQGGLSVLTRALDGTRSTIVVLEYPFYPTIARVLRSSARRFVGDIADDRIALARQTAMHAQPRARVRAVLDLASLMISERGLADLDQAWFASDRDAETARRRFPGLDVRTIPNVVDARRLVEAEWPPATPLSAAFLGSLDYAPNEIAARRFIDSIVPRLRQVEPTCRLAIIGRAPPPGLRAAAASMAVEVLGDVDDAMQTLSGFEVMVVPVAVGSGTRLKILEALASGVSVVSTTVGMAGLELVPDEHLLRADIDSEIAELVVRLWRSPELRARMSAAGRAAVLSRYSHESLERRLRDALSALV